MLRFSSLSLISVLALGACATTSPQDASMSNAMCEQGKVLLQENKPGEARDLFASATKRDNSNARAWNGLGVAYDMLGKHDDAEKAYKEAVDADPHSLAAINNLAHSYIVDKKYDTAVKLLAPHLNDPNANTAIKQNYAEAAAHTIVKEEKAETAQKVEKVEKAADSTGPYAELGTFPTEGMAQGHVREAKHILGRDAKGLSFTVVPEVNVIGGVPSFAVHVTGRSPEDLCEDFNAEALPCVPRKGDED